MKTQPWHSTVPNDPKVYHDNDNCRDGNHVDSKKRESGTDNRPKCVECDRLDRGEVGENTFTEGDNGSGNNPDRKRRKDRSNDPGNPNNPSPSHPNGPTNPTDPINYEWTRAEVDDWNGANWERMSYEKDQFRME